MAFEDLEAGVDDAVIEVLANADVSINGGPTIRGIFDRNPEQALGMVDTPVPVVSISESAAESVERDAEVLINGATLYRVIGIESDGGLVTLRLGS